MTVHPDTDADSPERLANSVRPEPEAWARQLQGVARGEPVYDNYEVTHATEQGQVRR